MSAARGRRRASAPMFSTVPAWVTRTAASIAALALVAGGLVVGFGATTASAAYPVELEVTTDPGVLAGEQVAVSLAATNPGTTNLYNLSYTFRLPAGVDYVGGSTTPVVAGEPAVVPVYDTTVDPAVLLYRVLIWSNASDLPIGDSRTLGFSLMPDPTLYPVGSAIQYSDAGVFANSSPRIIPRFDAAAQPLPASFNASASQVPTSTVISAIAISKSEPSPESELLRGVHDQSTTYTLTVRNTTQGSTDDVVVVDYLPAGLEFLQCGGIDNSTVGTVEYDDAPRLTVVPAPSGPSTDCRTPQSVTTVTNPVTESGTLTGVFTRVEWHLGGSAPGQVTLITYRAGIPLFENTTDWSGDEPESDGLDLAQAANLDNNSGASTRHIDETSGLTNHVIVTGEYQGQVAEGSDRNQLADDDMTVQVSDLSILKSASTLTFSADENVTFFLTIRAGEYADLDGLEVTDTIPDGLCPLVPDLAAVLTPGSIAVADQCYEPQPVSGATITAVTANADGTFSVVMTPAEGALEADGTLTVSYISLMRSNYQGASTDPTVAGDTFTNHVDIVGTSSDVTGRQDPLVEPVTDDSQATLGSVPPEIRKLVLPRPTVAGAVDCTAHAGEYVASPAPTYRLGDTVCFELRVDFSDSTETRDAQIQDFVPTGSSYQGFAVDAASTVPAADVSVSTAGGNADSPVFTIGAPSADPGDAHRYVAKGSVLVLYVWALVEAAPASDAVDITANLMKYRQESTSGTVLSLRTQAEYIIAPAATMAIDKSITSSTNPNEGDGTTQPAQGGDVISFEIKVSNTGTAFIGNDFPMQEVLVWDALPEGFACSTVSLVSEAGTCTDPGDTGHPLFIGSDTRSAITWTLPATILAGDDASVTYSVTVPQGLGVRTEHRNDASIVAFRSPNTSGGFTDYYPEDSLDISHPGNTAPANDFETALVVPDASVSKTATPNLVIPGATGNQVVAGETVSYTYSATIPAGTALFNGVLSDALPSGLTIAADATITASILGSSYDPVTITPTGFALDAAGSLTFPASYLNDTTADQEFSVTISRVLVGVTLASGSLTNTAKLASGAPDLTKQATVAVVSPDPTITKAASSSSNLTIGQVITYSLVIGNSANRPTGFDPVVSDCLPAALQFVAFVSSPAGAVTSDVPGVGSGAGANGCADGTRKLTWGLADSQLNAGSSITLTFTASIGNVTAGLGQISNTATVVVSTLDNGVNDPALELVVSRTSAAANVTLAGASTTKTVLQPSGANPQATVGETVRYQISVVLPANVNFYKAFVQDTLPGTGSTPWLTDLRNVTITCTAGAPAPSTDCLSNLPAGGSVLSPSGRSAGWYFGDVAFQNWSRTVTITFDATVADLPALQRDTDLVNTARLRWRDASTGAAPTNAASALDRNGALGTAATINVKLPLLTIDKSVFDAAGAAATTIEPGQVVTYRVTVANPTNSYGSTAFDATVVDTVPAGIVPDAASVTAGGGVLETVAGVTTITWDVPDLANGAAAWVVSYTASLGASSSIGTTNLMNVARIPSYRSLDGAGRTFPAISDGATVTPIFPSVQLSKSVSAGDLAYIGQDFQWTITAVNQGQASARSLVLTDVLPPNWTWVSSTLTVGGSSSSITPEVTTSGGVQTLVWPAIAQLAPGASATIVVVSRPTAAVTTNPGVGGAVNHTNTVSGVTQDLTGATGHGTPNVPYVQAPATASAHIDSADVRITKVNGDALVAGGAATGTAWTLQVSNAGPNTAVAPITVTDTPTLPAGVTVLSAQGTGWVCSTPASSGAFTCVRDAALASGTSASPITVSVLTGAEVPDGTEVSNIASVGSPTHDPVPANNTSEVATQVVTTSADLAITKSTPQLEAGQSATWTIGVSNAGPSVARFPITVTDTIPTSGLDDASIVASGTGWVCDAVVGGQFTCSYAGTPGDGLGIGSLPAITVTADVPSSTTGSLTNIAVVKSPTPDPVPENNTAIATNEVDTATTLTLTKDLLTDPLVPGVNATYRFTVTNVGTADASSVALVDVLPAGLAFASASGTGWTCDNEPGDTSVNCALEGTLPPGTSTLDLVVSTDPSLTGNVHNVGTVTWDPEGSVSAPNDSDLTGEADFAIVKTQAEGLVVAGTTHLYTLTVTNLGPSDSPAGVIVSDMLPTLLVPTDFRAPDGWSCAITGQEFVCTSTEPIPSGADASVFTVTVSIPADAGPAMYHNTATVDGVLTDPDTANDSSSVDTPVIDQAALSITKSIVGSETVTAGTQVSYDLVVTNDGPSVADSVTVSDVLPAGLTLVSLTGPDGWSCSDAACQLSAMPLGSATFTVVALVAEDVLDQTELTNTATVEWVDADGVDSDSDTATITVDAVADLTIDKTPDTQSALAGTAVSFTITVGNDGYSTSVGPISIVDTLPVGLRFESGTVGCTATDVAADQPQPVTCTIAGSLAPGGTIVVSITAVSDPGVGEVTLTNSATVTSPTDPEGATDTADVTFDLEADLVIAKTHTASAVGIGQELDFALDVTNAGPSDATGVTVVDTLPEGIQFVDSENSAAGWTCAVDADESQVVSCVLEPALAPDTHAPSLVLTTLVTAVAYPSVVNTATVSSDVFDPDHNDNTATDPVTVPPLVQLTVAKEHLGEVRIGERAVYLITVGNDGPTEDPGGYSVTDSLPVGLSYVSFEGDDVECAAAGQDVECVWDVALAVGDEREVRITVEVLPTAPSTIVNVVEAHSDWAATDEPVTAEDEANVLAAHPLPNTGLVFNAGLGALGAAALLALGALLWTRRRRTPAG